MTQLPADVIRLLDDVNIAHLATVLPDGSPHSVPVWIDREGDRIAIMTGPRSRKARNLARDPRVAISLTDRTQPYSTALIRGRVARVLDDEDAWRIIDRICRKYTGEPYPLRNDRVLMLIEPEHAQAVAFGATAAQQRRPPAGDGFDASSASSAAEVESASSAAVD